MKKCLFAEAPGSLFHILNPVYTGFNGLELPSDLNAIVLLVPFMI